MRVHRCLGRWRALRWLQRCRSEARASELLASPRARCVALAAALAFRHTCTMRVRRCLGRWMALRWLLRRRPEARASELLASSRARFAALAAPHAQL
jgi:hypothetical protein